MGVTFEIDHIIPLAAGGKPRSPTFACVARAVTGTKQHGAAPSILPRTQKYLFFTLCANVGPSTLHGATRA